MPGQVKILDHKHILWDERNARYSALGEQVTEIHILRRGGKHSRMTEKW